MTTIVLLTLLLLHAGPNPAAARPGLLGISYPDAGGGYPAPAAHLERLRALGFGLVSFVPGYSYDGLDRIDPGRSTRFDALERAVTEALRLGFVVVLKPHLEPPMYRGVDPLTADNDSWRAGCPWRGFFDVDPMSPDYRGMIVRSIAMLASALERCGRSPAAPVRLELGAELMNSTVHKPDRWLELAIAARSELARRGLAGRVILSHNFSHHFQIPQDFLLRMGPPARRQLADYLRRLDGVAVSQYMDLTAGVPGGERGKRLPTPDEVAAALRLHEANLRQRILGELLGLAPGEIPPLHLGEFGVGRGGLRHPNLWDGAATPEQERSLAREIAVGHKGLIAYLEGANRIVEDAVLWVTGRHYDVLGLFDRSHAIPEAARAIRAHLARFRAPDRGGATGSPGSLRSGRPGSERDRSR